MCCSITTKPPPQVAQSTINLSHQEIIALVLLGVAAVCLLAWAFTIIVKSYRVVQENEQLREYVAVHDERRIRGLRYFTDTLCRHDEGYLEYLAQVKLGLLQRVQPETKPPLRIHDYRVNVPQRDDWEQDNWDFDDNPPPHPQHHRKQPETRVVYVHAAPPREPREPQNLPYWRDDDDDVIDIEPSAPQPHRPMPQVLMLSAPKNRGGRPRKYSSNAERQRDYNQRKRLKFKS